MKAIWTDLAMESRLGAESKTEELDGGIERTVVTIDDELSARELGRPKGMYVTLSCPQTMTPLRLSVPAALLRSRAAAA